MGEYVLSYNYITAPFMYGKIKYSSPYRTKKYSFSFHKDHKSRFTKVPNQLEKIEVESYKLRLFDMPEVISRNRAKPTYGPNSLSDHLDRDRSPMFLDNERTTDVFIYKSNTNGTKADNNIISAFKTFNKGIFVIDEKPFIGDNGKYRNIIIDDVNDLAYKTIGFGLHIFNDYFASKNDTKYVSYYNKDTCAHKAESKELAIFIYDDIISKSIAGKSIITYSNSDWELAAKDRFGIIVSNENNSIIHKSVFKTFEIEFSGSPKKDNEMSFISENSMSNKDIASLYTQNIELAKNMVGGRNVINEMYSWAAGYKTIPVLNIFENNNSYKTESNASDMYEDSSFNIPKHLFFYKTIDNSEKTFTYTMPDIEGSFFNIDNKYIFVHNENLTGYLDSKDMSILDSTVYGYKDNYKFIINSIDTAYKHNKILSSLDNSSLLFKEDYNALYQVSFSARKNFNTRMQIFKHMLGLPSAKDIFYLNTYLGKKKSDSWSMFGDNGNTGSKKYKDIWRSEMRDMFKSGKDSFDSKQYLVTHGWDRNIVTIDNVSMYKIRHSTVLNIDGLFHKIEHGTAPVFTQYMMYKDIYHMSNLYKIYGTQSIHNETFGFRRIYHAFTTNGIMLAENGIHKKYGDIDYSVHLAYKVGKRTDIENQYFLSRSYIDTIVHDYFIGSYKSAKSSYVNNYYELIRTIYDLISPNTDSKAYKSWKVSNVLSSDYSGLRNNRFTFVDNISTIGTEKIAKNILNIKIPFIYRKIYDATYSYFESNAYKSAHITDPTDWMHLFVDYTGAIGRNVFIYDASIIHKIAFDIHTDDNDFMFMYKKIPNIHVSDENTFSLKTITNILLSFTESIYKMYTDTYADKPNAFSVYKMYTDIYTEILNQHSVYKIDRYTNIDYYNHFVLPKTKHTVVHDSSITIIKRYYDVMDDGKYSNLFISKRIYNSFVQDKIPLALKPDYDTNIIFSNLYIDKKNNDTIADYNGKFIYKVWQDVPVQYCGENITKTLLNLTEGYNSDIIDKKRPDVWYISFDDKIDKPSSEVIINKYYDEVEHIRRKIVLIKDEPYVIKDRYGFDPGMNTFEEIFKVKGDITPEKVIWWTHKKDVVSSSFSDNELYIFKTTRNIDIADATAKWITIHKYGHDMYPTEHYVTKSIRNVNVDDSKFNNVFRNMFSVDAWMMINANAGGFIGISARNLEAQSNIDTFISKISRSTMTSNDLLTYLKADKCINENSIIPINISSESIDINNDLIPYSTSRNIFFDDGLFTYKVRRSVDTFACTMIIKDKIKTFIDNYGLSIYKKSFDVLAQYSGYIIHKKSKPIYAVNNGFNVYKNPYRTAIHNILEWFSVIKGMYLSSTNTVTRTNKIFMNDSIPITTHTKEIFMYDMLTTYYEKYVSLYDNVYVTDLVKTPNINEEIPVATKDRIVNFTENVYANRDVKQPIMNSNDIATSYLKSVTMNTNDIATGHLKSAIINMTDIADEMKRILRTVELEVINFSKSNSVSIISLDGHNGGHSDTVLIPVAKLYNNVSYMEIDSVLKKYLELNMPLNDFDSWAWVEEPNNPFDDYNDLQRYGGIDELLLPEQDYRYENFEDILFNRKTNRPRNPVKTINSNTWVCKYPTRHPFKNTHPNAGVAYVGEKKDNYYGVNVKIMQEIYLKYYQIWQENLFKFSTMSMHEASNAMLEYIYSWILLYYPPENLEQAMRVFRQVRWFSECAVLNNSQYIISGDWTDLKMLDIPNDLNDNDTMYYDEKTFSFRNTPESLGTKDPKTGEVTGRTEASIEFHVKVWKDTVLTFSVLNRYGTMNLYIDDELVDQISSTRRFNQYLIKFTDEETTIRFEKTEENNVGDFLLANVTLQDQKFGELEIQFDPKLKAGNKILNMVADKMAKWANMYDDAAEAFTELQKKHIGIAVTVDMMKEYLELHHKNKTKGKRLTIKKT